MNAKPAMPGEGREGPPPSTGRDSEPLTRDAERPTRTAERVAEAIERRHATDAEAKALASSVRLRILRLCLNEALTNREIAEATGLNPATSLHHVRMLADTGFLAAQEVRRGRRGAREIPYLATGKSWFIDAGDVTNPMIDAFSAEFSAAPYEERTMSRMAAMLTAEEVVEFRQRLESLIEDFRSRNSADRTESAAEVREWAVFVAMHPSTRTSSAGDRLGGPDDDEQPPTR
ncbi:MULTISPECIES: ArsR/SmtB family transcription factor [Micrococcales]|uniref:Winged helix-turn-helix transcriptional regulator n=2 Tax=Brevibacterium casei TaxID=33889 RepID=A0A7T2TGD1_9MICO|nr:MULTISPECIES: winged helix-turn-helix domain-containing protein [Micrococcales]MDH5148932.1 winged helix-turn-helix domain-containing protein [Brevibacterium casei]QPS33233.1 winged helix-turn-helix transcriptional regulator [Brevibacterium casei]